jgi:hypothetical protein
MFKIYPGSGGEVGLHLVEKARGLVEKARGQISIFHTYKSEIQNRNVGK